MLDISEREAVKAIELASALLHVELGPLLGLEILEAEHSKEAEAEGQYDFDHKPDYLHQHCLFCVF